jgi:WXG100 family type VII secretion target
MIASFPSIYYVVNIMIIQAKYDDLEQIAQRFRQQAEHVEAMLGRLRMASSALEEGGWQGKGSSAFFSEMQQEVIPATQRLVTALTSAESVTLTIRQTLRTAEEEAGKLFADRAQTKSDADTNQLIGPIDTLLSTGKNLFDWWKMVKQRYDLYGYANGIRFVKDADGMWRAFGSQTAKEVLGLPKNLTRFGQEAIEKNVKHFRGFGQIKDILMADGSFKDKALRIFRSVTTSAPLEQAQSFLSKFKGGVLIDSVITLGQNIYEFGWGDSKDKGFQSREFVTATTADVSAAIAITAVSAAIPVPFLNVAVGIGLGLAYDHFGKEAWRNAVDEAGKFIQDQAPKVGDAILGTVRDIKHAGEEVYQTLKEKGSEIINTVQDRWEKGKNVLGSLWNKVTSFG